MAVGVTAGATPFSTGTLTTNVSGLKLASVDVDFDNSYPTGGESVTAAQFGLTKFYFIMPAIMLAEAAGTTALLVFGTPSADGTTAVLQVYWSAASGAAFLQVTNTTDLTAYTCRVYAMGV